MSDRTAEPPLPDLHEAVIPWETVDALLLDVTAVATLLEVRVKRGPRSHAGPAAAELDAARAMLASGEAVAMQLRYRHEGAVWCDTLMRVAEGVRIVRMRE